MNLNFDLIREELFSGRLSPTQFECLKAIVASFHAHGDKDKRKLAYILATAYHETMRFKYMREIWGPSAAQKRYEGRDDLGNTVAGDGRKFLGRGFVQITGRRNYTDWSKRLGLDLLKEPTLAEDRQIAARILVQGCMLGTFTGKKLGDYINSAGVDFKAARKVVNGTDKASLIAGYAVEFLEAIVSAPAKPAPLPPVVAPYEEDAGPDFLPPFTPPKPRKTLKDLLIGWFVKRTIS